MKKIYISSLLALASTCSMYAAQVQVKLNSTTRTMTLVNKSTSESVAIGDATSYTYKFEAEPGTYVITGYASDATTVNGTLELVISDEAEQAYTVQTVTTYATNKDAEGATWQFGTDYTIDFSVAGKDGSSRVSTLGNSTSAGRKTFLVFNGDSYTANLVPSEAHASEGYLPLVKTGTVTANPTVSGAIPMGADFSVTVPNDAEFFLGTKSSHFVDFAKVEPKSVAAEGANNVYTYRLADAQEYNYRTWKEGGLTNAGYFKMSIDETKRPTLAFTAEDYSAKDPHFIERDLTVNNKYNVCDIFVNASASGQISLKKGEDYNAFAQRNWQIINTVTANYFIEPDYHYTVLNLNGEKDNSVITVEEGQAGSAWATLHAVGEGTAIVLVTYDALAAHSYNGATKGDYVGGAYWGAIWPENTAAYVVTVGQPESAVVPNMTINAGLNTTNLKLAGDNVDAELDVFYYVKGSEGYAYTFAPENAVNVEVAYPTIGEQMATYSGFSTEGVAINDDDTYTVMLKNGRQIVKLTDANGASVYQVLTAKEVEYELSNVTNPESTTFAAGDKVAVKFNTLYHPANKLSGVHNFNATIEYTDLPEGVKAVKGTANQYQFAATEKAQTYTVTLPADWDGTPVVLNGGAIRLGSFGDPLGNHRKTSRTAGRNANFTAVQNTAIMGALPAIKIANPMEFNIATLEDVELAADSHTPQITEEFDEEYGFQSGDFWFDYGVMSDWGSWWGYGVANHTATTFKTLADQFNSVVGQGVDGSENYGVSYQSDWFGPTYITVLTEETAVIPGFYVTNAAYAFTSMRDGDGYAKKFGAGDWFKITVTGYDDEDTKTGSHDFYLADLRSENPDDWYIVNDWQYVDLSSLGYVRSLAITLDSSDKGDWGMNTPSYFCYDNVGAQGTETVPAGNMSIVTAISNAKTNVSAPMQRFDLMGRRAMQQRGIQIIRMSDGSVRKVVK